MGGQSGGDVYTPSCRAKFNQGMLLYGPSREPSPLSAHELGTDSGILHRRVCWGEGGAQTVLIPGADDLSQPRQCCLRAVLQDLHEGLHTHIHASFGVSGLWAWRSLNMLCRFPGQSGRHALNWLPCKASNCILNSDACSNGGLTGTDWGAAINPGVWLICMVLL